jgi:hypothetical protein
VSLLIVVADVFELQDGTLHFAPGVPFVVADETRLKPGDHLELRRPDGSIVETNLLGLDLFYPTNGTVGLGLGKPLTKKDIPVGTEIWKVG